VQTGRRAPLKHQKDDTAVEEDQQWEIWRIAAKTPPRNPITSPILSLFASKMKFLFSKDIPFSIRGGQNFLGTAEKHPKG
jgi:hypothetical protein